MTSHMTVPLTSRFLRLLSVILSRWQRVVPMLHSEEYFAAPKMTERHENNEGFFAMVRITGKHEMGQGV